VLGGRGGRYSLVSSTSAYAAPQTYGFTEDSALTTLDDRDSEEITDETYDGLKVLCEQAAQEGFGDCLIVRPTYVIGPLDYSGRFAYWVNRLAAGGEVLAPMWPGANPPGILEAADPSRALGVGLVTRPLRDTAVDVLASERADPAAVEIVGTDESTSVGLDRARETELLQERHAAVR